MEKSINIEKAQKWAEDYLKSEEGRLQIERCNKDFANYLLFGTTNILDENILYEVVSTSRLGKGEILQRFKHTLTEEQLKILNGE